MTSGIWPIDPDLVCMQPAVWAKLQESVIWVRWGEG